jgi:hypothetical protein
LRGCGAGNGITIYVSRLVDISFDTEENKNM